MERTKITVDHTQYIMRARNDARGGVQISRIAPYDETEYHWALSRIPGNWTVYRQSQAVSQVLSEDSEDVAAMCKRLDEECRLHRTGGIY